MSVLAKITIFIRQRSLLTRLLLLGGLLLVAFTAVASIAHLRPTVTAPVYIALVFPLVGLSLRRLRLDVATTGIVLAGLALYLVVLGYTSIGERNFDGGEQLAYIEYIIKNRALPPASHCLICHHPPTYYVVGAAVHAFFRKTRLASPVVGLQLFSILIFLVFLTAAILTLRRFARTRGELRLGAALVVFWPYSIQNSVRLHNDTLVYAWMALAFYFIVAWSEGRRPRDLYLAGLFSALGVATKTSAIAMVALLLLLVGARLLTGPDRPRLLRRAGVVAALLAAAMSMNGLLRAPVKARATAAESGLCQRVLGSACNVGGLLENEPYNYVYLDVQSFLKEPYLLSDRDETGRQLFWNHLLKSSLFATHNKVADAETAYRWNRRIAGVMNALLLGMTAFLGFAALAARREAVRRYALPLGAIAISMAFMLGFRILLPVPHHTDFRHVYHLVVPTALLYAAAARHLRERGVALGYAAYALAVPFVLLAIVYVIPKQDMLARWMTRVVPQQLSSYSTVVPEGSAWDRKGNLIFEGGDIVEFKVPSSKKVSEIDVTLDSNDRYEIQIAGEGGEARTVLVGPGKSGKGGLVRYVERVDPPVERGRTVRLRALGGDHAYSMGHLLLR